MKKEFVVYISKKAATALKNKTAELTVGGVRDLNTGQMLELFKPLSTASTSFSSGISLGPVGSVIQLVSSIGNNVQSAFIQKGVNQANLKLDEIQKTLATMQFCPWVNSMLSIVNIGITISGLTILKRNIDQNFLQLSNEINQLSEKFDGEIIRKLTRDCKTYMDDLKYFLDLAYQESDKLVESELLPPTLNKINHFLSDVIDRFERHEIEGEFGAWIIFNLSVLFSQVIQEYANIYLMKKQRRPINLDSWLETLDSINSPSFKNYLKQFLYNEYPLHTTKEISYVYHIPTEIVRLRCDAIKNSQLLLEEHDIRSYSQLKQLINDAQYIILEEK